MANDELPEDTPEVQEELEGPGFFERVGLPEPKFDLVGERPQPEYKGFDIETAVPPAGVEDALPPPLAAKASEVGQRTAPAPTTGKGAAKEVGSVSFEGTPPPDPRLVEEQVKFRSADAQLEMAQNQTRSLSLGIESQLNESFAYGLENEYEKTSAKIGSLLGQAEEELQAVDELIQKARSNQINPGQFFANVGEAGKFAAAIAVGAGAMASAFGGGPNAAYLVISRAIDRNVRAQMVNQQHERAMISHQMNFVHGIRALAGDHANLGNITRAALTGIVQAYLEQTRAASGSQLYQIQSQRVIQQFGADMADAAIQARQNIKFKYQMKFHNEAQADRRTAIAQLALQNAIGRATGTQPVAATPRQSRALAPPPSQEARAARPAEAASVGEGPDLTGKTPQEQAELIARHFQEKASVEREPGDIPSTKEIDAIWRGIDPTGESPVAQALRALPDSSFTPLRSQPSIAIHAEGLGTRHLQLRDPEKWKALGASEQAKVQHRVGRGLSTTAMLREYYQMVGMMSRGKDTLGDLMRRGRNGELIFPLFADGSDTELISRLTVVAQRIANLARTKSGPDAVRAIAEWDLWMKLAAGGVITTRQQIVDVMRNDPKVRQAKIKPYLDFERNDVLTEAVPHFTNFD